MKPDSTMIFVAASAHMWIYERCWMMVRRLAHWGRVAHTCVRSLIHHWLRLWLAAYSAPSHYLNQCWNIDNWTLRNKLQWNFNRNSNILIEENAIESVFCKVSAILCRPQCVRYVLRWHSMNAFGTCCLLVSHMYRIDIKKHVINNILLVFITNISHMVRKIITYL